VDFNRGAGPWQAIGSPLPFAIFPAAEPGPNGSGFAYVLLVGKFIFPRSVSARLGAVRVYAGREDSAWNLR
jgi:hypothetical protein